MRTINGYALVRKSRKQNASRIRLSCNCQKILIRKTTKIFLWKFLHELSPILRPNSSNSKRILKSLFLLPSLLWHQQIFGFRFSVYSFSIETEENCFPHKISEDATWLSPSASRHGFDWPYDSFSNALDVYRDSNIDVYVFGVTEERIVMENNSLQRESIRLNLDIFQKIDNLEDKTSSREFTWLQTDLYLLKNGEILHGAIITKNNRLVHQDLDSPISQSNSFNNIGSVWLENGDTTGNSVIYAPKTYNDLFLKGRTAFVNGNSNIYHFLSESVRILVMCHEAKIELDNIVIRCKLPRQFYEILEFFFPDLNIIIIEQGQLFRCESLYFAVYSNRLSAKEINFQEQNLHLFAKSDEARVWNFFQSRLGYHNEEGGRLIYIPRQRKESRGIYNDKSVSKMFEELGFLIVDPNLKSADELLDLLSKARLLCTTDGAAMTNMIFMKPGSLILELYTQKPGWINMTEVLGLEHFGFKVRSMFPTRIQSIFDTYYVPIKSLRLSLLEILNVHR
jgi:hypothetical protein